jgi:hypothetical protein
LGNDSTLSLSTTAASIAGTLAVTGNATFDTNTLFVDAANNRVGVGTATPANTLDVAGAGRFLLTSTTTPAIRLDYNASSQYGEHLMNGNGDYVISTPATNGVTSGCFGLSLSGTFAMRILANRNIGIGTEAPAVPLDVVGNIRSSTGILFGADTAAANLLDDYEEGTWTMGVSFGGAAVGVTYGLNSGLYTKIGRQVTVSGLLSLSSKGSSTGSAFITGLPFTVANNLGAYAAASLSYITAITFANQISAYGDIGTTTLALTETLAAGTRTAITDADFANNSEVMVSFTYTV